ncbi:MAG: DUF1653 domain-containing protein [Acetatifactor sp.]|nr:DUF1653 domain-containing protein [Acetatifactor sp.]MDE6700787.1 DUF1653 domain-containing protein [Acetatifactor sp.]
MSFMPRPHEIYKHFKGNLYQITAVAQHTETDELLVVYQALYGDFKTYARPLEMFLSEVDRQKYPDAKQKYRFELQSENPYRQQERESAVESGSAVGGSTVMPESASESDSGAVVNVAPVRLDKPEKAEGGVAEEELQIDPQVLEFLDADSYEQRLNILAGLHHRITDDMITTMAVACDIEVPEGDTQERYASLKSCLLTLEKYECNRLRQGRDSRVF